jgi:hypothetical protein
MIEEEPSEIAAINDQPGACGPFRQNSSIASNPPLISPEVIRGKISTCNEEGFVSEWP